MRFSRVKHRSPFVIVIFVLVGCHNETPHAVTLVAPQTSGSTQPSSSATLFAESPEATTKRRAATLVGAMHSWRAKQPDECPIPQRLVREGVIVAELAVDGWARPFKVECDDELTTVSSFGADGKEGTTDDIRSSM